MTSITLFKVNGAETFINFANRRCVQNPRVNVTYVNDDVTVGLLFTTSKNVIVSMATLSVFPVVVITFPSGKRNYGIIGHTTKLTARAPLVEASGRASLCVGACVHWHDINITRMLCFAQLRTDIISDHVIATSACQRERSRSGSATNRFLHFCLVFLVFASSSCYLYNY